MEPGLVLESLEHRQPHSPILDEACLWHAWGTLVLLLPDAACASCLRPRAVGFSPSSSGSSGWQRDWGLGQSPG